jgi:A/G-specific adenine glycosylase
MFTTFTKAIVEWHDPQRRFLPWKADNTPYHIWLSEIILQQTRVEQGTPYYLAFKEKFPTVHDLAQAPLSEVLKTWEGLGYYSRARNLHTAAQQIVHEYQGNFPDSYDSLLRLKGVGSYTAAAIASFAFGLPHAVLDGNVFRVLSRYFGIGTPIDSTEGKKYFSQLAQQCLDTENPARYNQAIMDFGALVCVPQQPTCHNCPLSSNCVALRENKVLQLPVKAKKMVRQQRCFNFLVITDGQYVVINQRAGTDIWKGLYQFPIIEGDLLPTSLSAADFGFGHLNIISSQLSPVFRQILTHRNIAAHFLEIRVASLEMVPPIHVSIRIDELEQLAFPKIIRNYLEESIFLKQ